MSERNLSRIGALLAKAEATDNEHEAQAYMEAAQRLATLAEVDLAVAREHVSRRERRAVPTQRTVEIGQPGTRGLRTFVQLYLAIARSNSVTCDIARDSSRVFAYGFDADLDTVQALYSSLVVQMVRACAGYLSSPERALDVELRRRQVRGRFGTRTEWVPTPVHATTARIGFQQAFAERIGDRLAQARSQARQDVIKKNPTTGVELVLRAKEIELADHYRSHSQARGAWGGYRGVSGSDRSRQAGDRAAAAARLKPAQALGGARRSLP